ncbi:hypothetical protein QSI_4765 [Clostridioides difficile P28]|nr:hypothetical protein QSI_4765 [Clostridioides difficile P28]
MREYLLERIAATKGVYKTNCYDFCDQNSLTFIFFRLQF